MRPAHLALQDRAEFNLRAKQAAHVGGYARGGERRRAQGHEVIERLGHLERALEAIVGAEGERAVGDLGQQAGHFGRDLGERRRALP
jgi:hypothetical protein